jgi:hypothetical protein
MRYFFYGGSGYGDVAAFLKEPGEKYSRPAD